MSGDSNWRFIDLVEIPPPVTKQDKEDEAPPPEADEPPFCERVERGRSNAWGGAD